MDRSDQKPPSPGRSPLLRRIEQFTLGTLVLAGIVSLGGYLAWHATLGRRLIDIDNSPSRFAQFQVDINSARWPELAQLPGVGETIARRIVDERLTRGPFMDHDDLRQRVRGIGPRTLEKIRPYLLPMAETGNVAGQKPRGLPPDG